MGQPKTRKKASGSRKRAYPLTIRIDDAVEAAARKFAKDTGMTLTDVVERALQQAIALWRTKGLVLHAGKAGAK